jgi:hypothetical protein
MLKGKKQLGKPSKCLKDYRKKDKIFLQNVFLFIVWLGEGNKTKKKFFQSHFSVDKIDDFVILSKKFFS